MTHASIPEEQRKALGVTDTLVRYANTIQTHTYMYKHSLYMYKHCIIYIIWLIYCCVGSCCRGTGGCWRSHWGLGSGSEG